MKQIEIVTFHPADESDLDLNSGLTLDVIAVHGLNGDLLNTWTEPKSKKLWLRDFLPKDFRGVRVMTFGYNATAAFENSVAGIKDHARGFLGALTEKRERNFEAKRPLIFIGHSLGGLVIKQALIIAEQESPYRQIYNSTLGTIFFGTPHQGSNFANYATTITRTLLTLANKPNAELLESLRKGGPALKQLSEDWKAHHERRPYQIVSFYETRTMKGMRSLIVEKSSALLTPEGEVPIYEDQIPVEATHRDMCRFANPRNKTYKDVVRKIKRIQREREVKVKSEFYVVPHASSTHFTGRSEVREKLSDSLIFYQSSKAQQIFVLYGLGGSGKTQISLKFAEDNRDSFWGIFWIDASSRDTAEEGFLNIARACKQEANVESVKRWLSRKTHWLLILDNADNPDLDISNFFPSRDRGTILITTRNPDVQRHNSAGSYKVDKLEFKDAVDLFLKTTAIEHPEDDNVRHGAERIVNELGCLALAIIQAGAVIRQGICSLDGFCDLFSKQKREVLESGRSITNVENYQYSVFTTWEISVEKIDEINDDSSKLALELLKMFSFMHFDGIRQEIFKDAVESFYDKNATIFERSFLASLMANEWDGLLWGKAIKLLLSFSLITISYSGLISMHPLVHLWSRERISASERADTRKCVIFTLWRSMSPRKWMGRTDAMYDTDGGQQKRLILPHIDSLLEYDSRDVRPPFPNDLEESKVVSEFYTTYFVSGHYAKALEIAQADFMLMKDIWGPTDIDFIRSRALVGQALQNQCRYRECIELLEPFVMDFPRDSHYTTLLPSIIPLASSYNNVFEYSASFELCTKALEHFEDVAPVDKTILAVYHAMVEALIGLKRPKEALIWAEKAILGNQRKYGPQHMNTYLSMEYMTAVLAASGDLRKAVKWQKKIVVFYKDNLGPDDHYTLMAEIRLVDCLAKLKFFYIARGIIVGRRKPLLEKLTLRYGERDHRTLTCQYFLIQDYYWSTALGKALRMQEKWLELVIQEYGQEHYLTKYGIEFLSELKRLVALRKALYWWLPESWLGI